MGLEPRDPSCLTSDILQVPECRGCRADASSLSPRCTGRAALSQPPLSLMGCGSELVLPGIPGSGSSPGIPLQSLGIQEVFSALASMLTGCGLLVETQSLWIYQVAVYLLFPDFCWFPEKLKTGFINTHRTVMADLQWMAQDIRVQQNRLFAAGRGWVRVRVAPSSSPCSPSAHSWCSMNSGVEARRARSDRLLGKRYQSGANSSAQFVLFVFGCGFFLLVLFFLTAVVFWLHLTRQ